VLIQSSSFQSEKEPYISTNEPYISAKDPYISAKIKTDLCLSSVLVSKVERKVLISCPSSKRMTATSTTSCRFFFQVEVSQKALYIRKRALYIRKRTLHIHKRALHIRKESCIVPPKSPTNPQNNSIYQEDCVYLQQGSICPQHSPVDPQKITVYPQKSPMYPPKRPTTVVVFGAHIVICDNDKAPKCYELNASLKYHKLELYTRPSCPRGSSPRSYFARISSFVRTSWASAIS